MLAFGVAVIASAVLLVPATMNYLELYSALSHIYLRVNSVNIHNSSLDATSNPRVVVSANLSLFHNSSYVGLKVFSVDIVVYYGEQPEVLLQTRFWLGDTVIMPFSSLDLQMSETSVYNPSRFLEYNNQARARGEPVTLGFSSFANLYILGNAFPERVDLEDVSYQMLSYVS